MGWFSSSPSPSTPTHPPASSDGGFIAPDRTQRILCWEKRDAFFTCLDGAGIIDSVRDDAAAKQKCGAELKGFEEACALSWVTYFKKRRVMEFQRDQTMKKLSAEGAVPMEVKSGR